MAFQDDEPIRLDAAFARLLETLPDAVLVVGADGGIQKANRQVETMFGWPREQLVGASVETLIPERFRPEHERHRAGYFQQPPVRPMGAGLELFGLRASGQEFPVDISLSPLRSGQGLVTLAAIRDITEQVAARRALDRARHELDLARRVQRRLLPSGDEPDVPEIEVGSVLDAAEMVSGDFYDLFPLGEQQLAVVIGDVVGHGLAAALLMADTQAYVKALIEDERDLTKIVSRVDALVRDDTDADQFVTMLLAAVDAGRGWLRYVNAGHTTGYLLDSAGELKAQLTSTGPLLGVFDDGDFVEAGPIALTPGDLLCVVSDGVTEASMGGGKTFGKERLLEVLRGLRDRPARDVAAGLLEASRAYHAEPAPPDDRTIVVIRVGRAY